MEDPWGSPWDVDAAAPIPGLLKTDTKDTDRQRGFGGLNGFSDSPWSTTNGALNTSNDNDDEAWGGWNNGRETSWEQVTPANTDGFDEPWKAANDDAKFTTLNKNVDSAISFGDTANHEVPSSPERAPALNLLVAEQSAWDAATKEPKNKMAASMTTVEPEINFLDLDITDGADVLRKSSKVQGLVEMYDGIAKKASTSELHSQHGTELPQLQPAKTREVGEPIHAELLNEQVNDATHITTPELSGKDHMESEPDKTDNDVPEQSEAPPGTLQKSHDYNDDIISEDKEEQIITSSATDTPKSSSIPYPVDLTNLDALFRETPCNSIATTSEHIPDTIVNDSFTNISERKTWYRISRFGSTLKHDSGNDDSYRRVTWANSRVRERTLKIVRGWMEQDSIAGRVVLGRKPGPLGASMFGWDSSEPQMEIGELLRNKANHIRNRSLPATETPVTPITASFGWNTTATVPSTPSAVVQSPTFAAHMGSLAATVAKKPESPDFPSSPWEEEPKSSDEAQGLGLEQPAREVAPPIEDVEDDDDWGEMVSSPTVDASTFPVSQPTMQRTIKPASFEQDGKQILSAERRLESQSVSATSTPYDSTFSGMDLFDTTTELPNAVTDSVHTSFEETNLAENSASERAADPSSIKSTPADDPNSEIIKAALRGLPDLSYMLR
jgi:hypothetical protein